MLSSAETHAPALTAFQADDAVSTTVTRSTRDRTVTTRPFGTIPKLAGRRYQARDTPLGRQMSAGTTVVTKAVLRTSLRLGTRGEGDESGPEPGCDHTGQHARNRLTRWDRARPAQIRGGQFPGGGFAGQVGAILMVRDPTCST